MNVETITSTVCVLKYNSKTYVVTRQLSTATETLMWKGMKDSGRKVNLLAIRFDPK